ncbi:GNAT family N-acetyltransferase [Streptomyces pilosus]|nr:GNAT family N-acetyltransferase [Streptomyces pilosus]
MGSDGWYLTGDVDAFLGRAGDFLRARPGVHVMQLTWAERVRRRGAGAFGGEGVLFGVLERAGEVEGTFYRLPGRGMCVSPLTEGRAAGLADRLAAVLPSLPSVSADHDSATVFAEAWRRRTGAAPGMRDTRLRLYRLGTLTPPDPPPAGRARVLGEDDVAEAAHWCRQFAEAVGEEVGWDVGTWQESRYADKRYTLWETPDGTPVAVAGMNPLIGGQVQVDVVHTPAHLRGRGYAGAVTAEVSRAALGTGARDVVLFADRSNPASNALYQRLGYRTLADWSVYDFT